MSDRTEMFMKSDVKVMSSGREAASGKHGMAFPQLKKFASKAIKFVEMLFSKENIQEGMKLYAIGMGGANIMRNGR